MVFDRAGQLWLFFIGRHVQFATPTSVEAHLANQNQG